MTDWSNKLFKIVFRLSEGNPGKEERFAMAQTVRAADLLIQSQAARIERLEAAQAQVQSELCRVANAYAAEGSIIAATAIHDAARCVAALKDGQS